MDKKGHRFTASEKLKEIELKRKRDQEIEEQRVYNGIANAMQMGSACYELTYYHSELNPLTIEHLEADGFTVEVKESRTEDRLTIKDYTAIISW